MFAERRAPALDTSTVQSPHTCCRSACPFLGSSGPACRSLGAGARLARIHTLDAVEILFLGGTNFLGRHSAGIALKRAHDVTLFHRGSGSDDPFPEAEHVHGDRDGALGVLAGRTWDVVVDTSGYVPRVVRKSVELLSDAVEHSTFVSTCSVYSDLGSGRVAEDGKLHEPPADSEDVMEHYGGL